MLPNSGLPRAPIRTRRSGWHKMNVEVRNTPRARGLLAQAIAAIGPGRRVAAPALADGVQS